MSKFIIYTPAFNAEKTIRRAVDSVLSQTHTDFVYYLLDNASTDSTYEIIKEYAECDKRIIPLHNEINWRGNWILDVIKNHSEDCYVCELDADDEYVPNFLGKMSVFIQKYNLDIATCGNDFVDAQTIKTCGIRRIEHDLVIKENGFNNFFPVYHQYMRTIWAKAYSVSVLRKPDYKTYRSPGYGNDTLFAMSAFHNANRVGILDESLHKYYISPKSVSHQFDEKRILSDQILFDAARDFLISKCGSVSSQNFDFILLVYLHAIKDTLNVLLNAQISVEDKLKNLIDICQSKHTQELIKWPGAAAEKNELFRQIALWVLSQSEVRSGDGMDAAAEILAAINMYPSQVNGWPDSLVFLLLTKIKDRQTKMGLSSRVDPNIVTVAAKSSLLVGSDADYLAFFREVVISILDHVEASALSRMINTIAQETDIPDQYAEAFITLGLNLSAKLEQTGDFILFKKLHISYLIDCSRIDEALKDLADWDDVLPEDMDFKALRTRMTQ